MTQVKKGILGNKLQHHLGYINHHLTCFKIGLLLHLPWNLNTDSTAEPVPGHGTLVQAVRGQLGLEAQSLGRSQGARDCQNLIKFTKLTT